MARAATAYWKSPGFIAVLRRRGGRPPGLLTAVIPSAIRSTALVAGVWLAIALLPSVLSSAETRKASGAAFDDFGMAVSHARMFQNGQGDGSPNRSFSAVDPQLVTTDTPTETPTPPDTATTSRGTRR